MMRMWAETMREMSCMWMDYMGALWGIGTSSSSSSGCDPCGRCSRCRRCDPCSCDDRCKRCDCDPCACHPTCHMCRCDPCECDGRCRRCDCDPCTCGRGGPLEVEVDNKSKLKVVVRHRIDGDCRRSDLAVLSLQDSDGKVTDKVAAEITPGPKIWLRWLKAHVKADAKAGTYRGFIVKVDKSGDKHKNRTCGRVVVVIKD